ncbi:uncharacterized protein LTR77_011120 [Saxophila tyrrhenica]|uniref:Rhodopsin domain-containing protein n=1 Tax=Saxophila tyrrhenica TaxID=1690608 RepID=A0AAV9NTN4_9PEZI|nr:hypothetical protein LTR77_011120 [Saxophila tyrrhenica]
MATTSQPPYTKWSDTDHAGPVIIVTTLSLLYWVVAGAGQQLLSYSSGLRYTWADGLFSCSMICGFIQSVLILVGAHYGLGKSSSVISRGDLSTAEEVYKVGNIFYIITLGLIKCSAACFTANLTVKNLGSLRQIAGKQMIGLYGSVALAIAWSIGSIVALAVPCPSYGGHANNAGMCLGTMSRWVGIFIGDAITDLAIVVFAATVIWRTKASIAKRLTWYIPFLVRACVPLWAGLRLLTINKQKLTEDPTIGVWLFVCFNQVQILLALIGAASPVLKKAMSDLVTNFGASTDSQARSGNGRSFALKYLKSKRTFRSNNDSQPTDSNGSKIRPLPFGGPGVSGAAMISRNRPEEKLRSDGDSQEGIIRQDDYEVSYFHTDNDREPVMEDGGYNKYR